MLDILRNNLMALLSAIEDCRGRKQVLPCLILLYSGIDIIASLERSDKEGTASAFQRWTNNYLLTEKNLGCSSKDLYGARCGIVHTFSSSSDYTRTGKAREVIYAWGNASAVNLRAVSQAAGRDNIVLDVDELIKVFRSGVNMFFADLSKDSMRAEQVVKNAGLWLMNIDKTVIDNVLDIIERTPDT